MKVQNLTGLKKWGECGLVAVILSLSANIAMADVTATGSFSMDNEKSEKTTDAVDADKKNDGPYFPENSK